MYLEETTEQEPYKVPPATRSSLKGLLTRFDDCKQTVFGEPCTSGKASPPLFAQLHPGNCQFSLWCHVGVALQTDLLSNPQMS